MGRPVDQPGAVEIEDLLLEASNQQHLLEPAGQRLRILGAPIGLLEIEAQPGRVGRDGAGNCHDSIIVRDGR
jgi:hypothetical protein